MKKRIFAVLSAILLLAACLPLGATSVTAGNSGDTGHCVWALNGTHLTISGQGAMEDYNLQNRKAPWGTAITQVTLEEGVTSVGVAAFEDCAALERVFIPTSVTVIRERAFQRCSSLTAVTIPDSVTSIGAYAFTGCEALTAVTIPDSVTSIGDYAFRWCAALTAVTIPAGVRSIGAGAFYHCDTLGAVTIEEGVTTIGTSAFESCGSLTSVSIPSSVTHMDYAAFRWCDALTDVYYAGTEEEWNAISFGDEVGLEGITLHFSDGAVNVSAATDPDTKDKKDENKGAWAILATEAVLVVMVMCLLLEWRSRKKKQKASPAPVKELSPLPLVDVTPYLGKKWCSGCGELCDGDTTECGCGSRHLVTLTAENAAPIVAQLEGAQPAPELEPIQRMDPPV